MNHIIKYSIAMALFYTIIIFSSFTVIYLCNEAFHSGFNTVSLWVMALTSVHVGIYIKTIAYKYQQMKATARIIEALKEHGFNVQTDEDK